MSRRALALAVALLTPVAAPAQQAPADLTALPPVPSGSALKTEWGDPDLRATYTLDMINNGRIAFQRPDEFGSRMWLTDAEFAKRLAAAKASDAAYSVESTRGTKGLEAWTRAEPFARRTSMLVSPADGKLPPLLPAAEALRKAGRSSWVAGQAYDWLDDFDPWDRCITRGFPGLDAAVPLQQRHPRVPGAGLRRDPLRDARRPDHPARARQALAPSGALVDGRQPWPLGRPDAGRRDEQHP